MKEANGDSIQVRTKNCQLLLAAMRISGLSWKTQVGNGPEVLKSACMTVAAGKLIKWANVRTLRSRDSDLRDAGPGSGISISKNPPR